MSSYEDYLIREMNDGPVHWCSQCERDAEDCICSDNSALGGHADSDDVGNNVIPCVPLSLSAPPPSENALTEFDRVALSGGVESRHAAVGNERHGNAMTSGRVVADPRGSGSSAPPAQTPVQILNQTFDKVMRHFKI